MREQGRGRVRGKTWHKLKEEGVRTGDREQGRREVLREKHQQEP